MIVCAGNNEVFDFATPIGVGMVESAINLTKLCLMQAPEFILFVGSAGTYGKHEIFDIVESKTASNIEVGFFDKLSYTPIDNVVSSEEQASVIVNSSNYISRSKEHASKCLRAGLHLENMEFFAVLKVAKELDIPCGGVFVVTNACHEKAHEEFMQNHEKAKVLLAEYMQKRAQGL